MFHGISHIDVQVTCLDRTKKLWASYIGFDISEEGEGFAIIDSGNVAIRLIEVPKIEHTTTIRIQAPDVTKAYQHLIDAGLNSKYEPMQTPDLHKLACVSDYDGNNIIVWRALVEDEWGFH